MMRRVMGLMLSALFFLTMTACSVSDAIIPQYISHANRYGAGHVLKITVK